MSDKPFLRVLKLAYKLHKSGLDVAETTQFICNCRNKIDSGGFGGSVYPSASEKPSHILLGSFSWGNSVEGASYWRAIHDRLLTQEAAC